MTMEVHWHEGLFLQPHHLQALQRQTIDRVASDRRLSWPHAYGVVEARLSTDELENMRVRFDRLRVVMPSGLELDIPRNADAPALDITDRFGASTAGFTVSLGVPLRYPTRANALEIGENDWRIKRLYRVVESESPDENTGENEQAMLLRRINARLLAEGDDTTDLEVLPLLRVVHAAGEEGGVPRLDPDFVPPCLLLTGSVGLREMLRDLANQVEASRKDAVVALTRAGFNLETMRGVQVQQMLRLQALNVYAARLMPLIRAAGGVSLHELYLELRGLQGALAALQPDRDLWDAPAYDHDDPGPVFAELCDRIRQQLRAEGTATWAKVTFDLRDGVLVADLTDDQLSKPNEYFLGIKTGRDPRDLAKLVEDADEFKLIALSMARTRVRGVRLSEERHPPLQLPSQVGLHYYRLNRAESQRMWEKIAAERSVAVNYTGVASGEFDEVSLFMTVPG